MPTPLVFAAFLVTISAPAASNDATSTGRKALLRQEVSSSADRQPVASDTIEAELLRTAVDLNLPPDETAQVVSASRAVIPRQSEATKMSLRDSVVFAAKRLGLSLHQVERLKMAMANLDHRSYVHLLQVFEAATAATVATVPAKVAAVVTAAAEANYSAEEVGAAAAAASVSLADDAATTTAPLESLADAVGQLAAVEGQAAVLSAAGGESARSQSIIAEMFRAITSTTPPVIPWDSLSANPFGSDPQIVADEIREEIKNLDIPDQEKNNILAAAMNAAAIAQRPSLRMNGTQGLEANFAGDMLALASAAFGAGFTDYEVAMLKLKWQDMTSQQRAAAKRSFDALASARAVLGLKNLGGNLSTSVASALKAFEDAGASAVDAAHVASDVLRAAHAARQTSKSPPKDKTGLQQTMENVKSARLSDQQAQAILKVLAGLPPEDVTPLAIAWAAIGGQTSAQTTQAPSKAEREKGGKPRSNAPSASVNLQALEDLSVVAFAALQVGMDFDLVEKADSNAKGLSPAEQMAAAAAILRQPGDSKAAQTGTMLKELEIGLSGP